VLFVNGHRLKPIEERPQQVSDALLLAAETMRYCICTTTALFEAVRAELSGDQVGVAKFRDAILRSDGPHEAPRG
jgi:hypothetical protein